MIRKGDIYWVDKGAPYGCEPGLRRPDVVIRNGAFHCSRSGAVVVCTVTTNLRLAQAPGNLLLEAGEANLPSQSVVNFSQILTLDTRRLGRLIGSRGTDRIVQVLEGVDGLLAPSLPEESGNPPRSIA